MEEAIKIHVGLDVHKDGITVAAAEAGRAGQLRAIWVPEPGDEAIRDLTRAREDGINSRTKARQQLKSFLLRHEVRYAGKTSWSRMHYRWLAVLNFGARAPSLSGILCARHHDDTEHVCQARRERRTRP